MSEKKIKKRYKDLKFMARQYVAGVLMVALLFNILPEILTPGLSKVYAVSISELILSAFVGSNLDDAANYDMLNTGLTLAYNKNRLRGLFSGKLEFAA